MVWTKPVCAIAKAKTKFFIEFFSVASLQRSFQHRELHFMVWRKPVCAIAKGESNLFVEFFSVASPQGTFQHRGLPFMLWGGFVHNMRPKLTQNSETKLLRSIYAKERVPYQKRKQVSPKHSEDFFPWVELALITPSRRFMNAA